MTGSRESSTFILPCTGPFDGSTKEIKSDCWSVGVLGCRQDKHPSSRGEKKNSTILLGGLHSASLEEGSKIKHLHQKFSCCLCSGCVFYLMLEGKAAFNYSVPRPCLGSEVMGDGHSYLMWSKVEGQESEKCRELWSVYHVEKAPKCHWKLNPYEHPSPLDRKWSSCLEKHHISFISFFTRLLIQFRCRPFAGMHGIQQLWAHNRTSKSYVFFLKAKIDKFKLPLCKLFPSLILYTLKI